MLTLLSPFVSGSSFSSEGQTPLVFSLLSTSYSTCACMHESVTQNMRSAAYVQQSASEGSSEQRRTQHATICMIFEQQMMYSSHGSGWICSFCMMKMRFADAASPGQQKASQHKHGILGQFIVQQGKIPRQHWYLPSPMIWSLHR